MGKVRGHFAFLCVQIVHTWVPCSTGLATLRSVKQVHANPGATVFSQGRNNHEPYHDMLQSSEQIAE